MLKILIAEDDEPIARVYEKAFKFSGYEVEIAFDGEEALEKLKAMKSRPAAILLDMMMPKLNGLQVVEKIKLAEEWKEFRDIPIVIITNLSKLTLAGDVEKAISLGAAECLLKSMYDPIALVKKVEEIIIKSNQQQK